MNRSLEIALVAGIVLAAMVASVVSGRTESQAYDEATHLAAGVSYLRTGDFRMNPEHPPLLKLLAGAAALTLRPTVPTNDPSWAAGDEWAFGRVFLYENRVDPDALLFAGRMPSAFAFGCLLVVLFLLARKFLGRTAGLVTLGFASVEPNLLAYSRYVMTDVLFTLGFVVTLWSFWSYLNCRSTRRLLVFGAILGLTLATKYSATLLLPILLLLALLWRLANRRARRPFRAVVWDTVAIAGVVFLTVWATYLFHAPRVFDDSRVRLLYHERGNVVAFYGLENREPFRTFLNVTVGGTTSERAIRSVLERVPIPSYPYLRGISFVWFHNVLGHPTNYLFGETSRGGWPYYFPIVLLLKTPLPLLVLGVAGLIWCALRLRRRLPGIGSAFLWLPPLLFLAFTIPSHYNIGVHHVLPVTLAFPLTAGFLASRSRPWLIACLFALLLTAIGTVRLAPSYLAFGNDIVGGPDGLPRYLLDGNLDLGQDLKGLGRFLRERGNPEVSLAYAGRGAPEAYGIRSTPLPTDEERQAGRSTTGLAAISVNLLYGFGNQYTWLRALTPIKTIGHSIYLYALEPNG